ncbi:MAG: linear amide C-N hydrolase [bacterium]
MFEVGCSCLKLKSKEGNNYWFRTCDMNDLNDVWKAGSKVISYKENTEIHFSNDLILKSKFDIIGVSYGSIYTRMLDGINSLGLVGGLLALGEGSSVNITKVTKEKNIEGIEFLTYALASCSSCDEVINLSKEIQLTNVIHSNIEVPATMHFTFSDNLKSIVLEATTDGIFTIYDNTIGVMTNSPVYSNHMKNLSWFIKNSKELNTGIINIHDNSISKKYDSIIIDGITVEGSEEQHNLDSSCLPGSYVSKDRFIKLAILKFLNNSGNDISDEDMFMEGSKIINTVVVPRTKGYYYYSRIEDDKIYGTGDNFTQYTIFYNLKDKNLIIKHGDSIAYNKFSINSIPNGLNIYEIDIVKNI